MDLRVIDDWFGMNIEIDKDINASENLINISDSLITILYDMSRSVITPKKKWHPQTTKYDYNYAVGMNFYQPMVDFIDEKRRGGRPQRPHLPWTEELGLECYSPKGIKCYPDEDFDRIVRQTEASAKKKLQDFKSMSKSSYLLTKSVSAASVTQQIKREAKRKKLLVKEIDKLKYNINEGLDNYFARQDTENLDFASQRFLRGRSAKQIESQLLTQADKIIAEGLKEDGEKKQRNIVKKIEIEHKIIDEQVEEKLEESIIQPLHHLKNELKDFDDKITWFYFDKR